MTITDLHSLGEFEEAIKSEELTVIKFSTKTCIPCKMIAPIYEKYSKAYKGAKYYNCDSEELVEVASMVPVSSVPTFALYKNGEIVLIVSGNGADPRKLRSGIRKYAAKDETKKPRPVTNGIKKRRRPKKIT
ncbi:thioredoxin-like protein [Yarrowia lipolytica]|jgi:thioredoxin 1|uniref:Uncharacterized protein n=1 Tax=Yarrowia lipolytica TaxID=4952 RepID=A0A1D8NHR6_YARLL|nr:hypothetical protein YALI1_E11619g [Yarrowia lipolytica]KAB8282018.1 thioredoxin-like protein [Yarrowia lipolytica]KAE8173425.1 thioredoxin-like protein [Yarrowia lipolytica]KAJ8056717.1 thioredoxin-like protein [Yarrowia lipolytica]QNP98879.1 Thioredoxin-1 [Yarrowia lipolytica]